MSYLVNICLLIVNNFNFMKLRSVLFGITTFMMNSCGLGDSYEERYITTFDTEIILKNQTGQSVDFYSCEYYEDGISIENNESISCVFTNVDETDDIFVFNEGVKIIFDNNTGYDCNINDGSKCFVSDPKELFHFTKVNLGIYTRIDNNTYEYVLTPELLEGVYNLN